MAEFFKGVEFSEVVPEKFERKDGESESEHVQRLISGYIVGILLDDPESHVAAEVLGRIPSALWSLKTDYYSLMLQIPLKDAYIKKEERKEFSLAELAVYTLVANPECASLFRDVWNDHMTDEAKALTRTRVILLGQNTPHILNDDACPDLHVTKEDRAAIRSEFGIPRAKRSREEPTDFQVEKKQK